MDFQVQVGMEELDVLDLAIKIYLGFEVSDFSFIHLSVSIMAASWRDCSDMGAGSCKKDRKIGIERKVTDRTTSVIGTNFLVPVCQDWNLGRLVRLKTANTLEINEENLRSCTRSDRGLFLSKIISITFGTFWLIQEILDRACI